MLGACPRCKHFLFAPAESRSRNFVAGSSYAFFSKSESRCRNFVSTPAVHFCVVGSGRKNVHGGFEDINCSGTRPRIRRQMPVFTRDALAGGGCKSLTHNLWTELQTRMATIYSAKLKQCNSVPKAFNRLREQPKRRLAKLGANCFAFARYL